MTFWFSTPLGSKSANFRLRNDNNVEEEVAER
jgi:hypothetical protein